MDNYGLLQLVNCPHANPVRTLWLPPARNPCTNSSSDIVSHPLHPENTNPCIAIGRSGDLIKTVWYKLTLAGPAPENPYDLLEEIEYTIGGQVIEKYSGTSLEIISHYSQNAKVSKSGNTLVFSLFLCTSGELALPLICLAFHEVKLSIKLRRDTKIDKHSVETAYVYIDTDERRRLCINQQPRYYQITQKFSIKRQVTCFQAAQTIKIPIRSKHLTNRIRDVAFKITPLATKPVQLDHDGLAGNAKDAFMLMLLERIDQLENRLSPKNTEPLVSATFVFSTTSGNTIKYTQDAAMLKHAIPREQYAIENNENVYYLSFDHTPTQLYSASSLCVSGIVLEVELELVPGRYELEILVRQDNVLTITSGMGSLKYPSLDS